MPSQRFGVGLRPTMLGILVLILATWQGPAANAAIGVRDFCRLVPMRDGACLATDIYLPRFPKGRYPAILIRTPYSRSQFDRLKARFACREGFALVVQEIRGSRRTHPKTALFEHDGWEGNQDGHTMIRWVSCQPWCNGQVVTWGPSAMGITQNMLAVGAPAALKAQVIAMAPSDLFAHAVFQGGALRKEAVEGWLAEMPYLRDNIRAVIAHPSYDAFWAHRNCLSQVDRVNTPALFIGGWHDAFLQGTLDSFTAIQNRGGPGARGKCCLVVGPWNHKDLQWIIDPRYADRVPSLASSARFFREQLCRCRRSSRSRQVCYYVMGDRCDRRSGGSRWCYSDNWPPPSTPEHLYLHADGSLDESIPETSENLTFQYDPCDPVPTLGGRNLETRAGPLDQRCVESRNDVLVFSTEPLEHPVKVVGRIEAQLYVSSDCPDTDFTVKLTDVYPDGRSILVCDGILRARFRDSFEKPTLLEPGKTYPLTVDLWSTVTVFSPGHRIRVAVSSSNAPRFEPNPNTGEPLLPGGPPQVATNTIHFSSQQASSIVLPVCSDEE